MEENMTEVCFWDTLINVDSLYIVPADVLQLVQNGDKFDKFMEKHFYSILKNSFYNIKLTEDIHKAIPFRRTGIVDSPVNEGRKLSFYSDYVIEFFTSLFASEPICRHDGEETDDYIKRVKEELRKIKRGINEVISGKEVNECDYLLDSYQKIKGNQKVGNYFDYLNIISSKISIFASNIGYVVTELEKGIDINELKECFDIQKLYLAIGAHLVHCNENVNMLDLCISLVANYCLFLEEKRNSDLEFNVSIRTYDKNGNIRENYNIDDFYREFNELLARHPEFKLVPIMYADTNGKSSLRNLDSARSVAKEAARRDKLREMLVDFEFIPNPSWKGKKSYGEAISEFSSKLSNKFDQIESQTKTDMNIQLLTDVNLRRLFMDSTNYLWCIKGINMFEGYIGYVYANGLVVFEKFYENIHTNPPKPSKDHATYGMDIAKFIDLSKSQRLELSKLARIPDSPVKRFFHTSGWSKKIYNTINGKGYDRDTIGIIENLLEKGEIRRSFGNGERK